jgi:2-oxoglutarate/2-oxoacid ferredoxin oxidoreductase subunit beta
VLKARKKGKRVGALKITSLFPYHAEKIREFMDRCEEILIPELNYEGQLANLIGHLHRKDVVRLNRTPGMPMPASVILERIEAKLNTAGAPEVERGDFMKTSGNHSWPPNPKWPRIKDKSRAFQESRFRSARKASPPGAPGAAISASTTGLNQAIQRPGPAPPQDRHRVGNRLCRQVPLFQFTPTVSTRSTGGALPVATGVKLAEPDLTVFAVGGDGDGLGIGGGHLPHISSENVDVNYLLFDNSIYGLTKGQPSPSSPFGFKTKASPQGNTDAPLNAALLALSYGASFVARLFAGGPGRDHGSTRGGDPTQGVFFFSSLHFLRHL